MNAETAKLLNLPRIPVTMSYLETKHLDEAEDDARLFSGVHRNKLRIVAAIILSIENDMLAVRKRGTSVFMQPGGKYSPGEEPLTALAREISEELGCELLPGANELSTFLTDAAHEPGWMIEATLFEARINGEPRAQAEIEELRWINPWNPGDLPLAPLTREFALPLARRWPKR